MQKDAFKKSYDDLKLEKYLGIDWGQKRIGLALADSETKLATPFKVVKNLSEVLDIIEKEGINEIILGLPLKMKNTKSETQAEFRNFKNNLKAKVNLPVLEVDERLSSKAADALSKDKKAKALRDALAAMLILQSYLDVQYKFSRN